MRWGTVIPRPRLHFENETEATDVNDKFLGNVIGRPSFVAFHFLVQFFQFVVSFGPIKLFFGILAFLVWIVVMSVLPLCKWLFTSPMGFKNWSQEVSRILMRFLLFCIGFVQIDIVGKKSGSARIYVSNSLSVVDYLVYFCCSPITILWKETHCGLERALMERFFGAFPIRQGKKKICHEIANVASDPSFFPLMVFPEGTNTNGDAILSFGKDYFLNDYEIQPVAIQYYLGLTLPGFTSLKLGDKLMGALGLIWRILSVPFIFCQVTYLNHPQLKAAPQGPGAAQTKSVLCQLSLANHLQILAVRREYEDT
jgi:hypothetical protein